MKKALRVLGLCTLTIFILSLTVNNNTIFSYIYRVISPLSTATQQVALNIGSRTADGIRYYSNKLFNNSLPKKKVKDSLSTQMAAPQKIIKTPLEEINKKEKEELDELIKSH